MSKRVLWRPQARRDVSAIALYIAEFSPDAALRFLAAVETTMAQLVEAPGIGAPRLSHDARLQDLRCWPVKGLRNYLVFYRPTGGGIDVLRALHAARAHPVLFE